MVVANRIYDVKVAGSNPGQTAWNVSRVKVGHRQESNDKLLNVLLPSNYRQSSKARSDYTVK